MKTAAADSTGKAPAGAFAQKKWDGPGRPATMHKAVCAKCGNSCEVPFRPFNNRLVYCNDCFRDQKDTENRSRNKFPQKIITTTKNSLTPPLRSIPATEAAMS